MYKRNASDRKYIKGSFGSRYRKKSYYNIVILKRIQNHFFETDFETHLKVQLNIVVQR